MSNATQATKTLSTFTLSNQALTASEAQQRSNIRNAWFVMTSPEISKEIVARLERRDYFAAAVLVDLMCDYKDDE